MLAHYTRGFKSDKLEAQGGVLDKLVKSGVIGDLVTMSRNDTDRELVYNVELTARKWALNSAVECHLHTVEVIGSNPIAPTIRINHLQSILIFCVAPERSNCSA